MRDRKVSMAIVNKRTTGGRLDSVFYRHFCPDKNKP